ncbi:LOW QUALITY PROTEIN: Protein ALP1-like [Frankliniella fusca]|uniref:Protein ALP1-like n=1 Tax=Frankliniella fusca TaxID=407009 RepID=A0AAE1HMD8_9NEOP|nr:LOW QUALITY PROTEIN: Protein ALP1-like [Frankliniella fusca]
MLPKQFKFLHLLLSPLFLRQQTVMRLRLGLTLMLLHETENLEYRYLAQGESIQSLHDAFRVGKSTAHQVIGDTCRALWEKLQPIYLPELTRANFENVAARFFNRCQFPNCVQSMACTQIKAPPISAGRPFYDCMGFFSTVLLAIVDADYKFLIFVRRSCVAQLSNGKSFGRWANESSPMTPLAGKDIAFTHYIVGDEAFPLRSNLMCPLSGRMNRIVSRTLSFRKCFWYTRNEVAGSECCSDMLSGKS